MIHCGKIVLTKFCPECGANMGQEPLLSLLAHVKQTAAHYRTRVEAHKLYLEGQHGPDYRLKLDCARLKRVSASERICEKWETWERELERLIPESEVTK